MQTSPKAHQRQTTVDSRHDARRVAIPHLTQGIWICVCFLAGLLIAGPGLQPACAAPPGHEGHQRTQIATSGPGSVDVGPGLLGDQKIAHRSGDQVVVLANVTPKGQPVAAKEAEQEGQHLTQQAPIDRDAKKVTWVGHAISLLVFFVLGVLATYLPYRLSTQWYEDRDEWRQMWWDTVEAHLKYKPEAVRQGLYSHPDGRPKSLRETHRAGAKLIGTGWR